MLINKNKRLFGLLSTCTLNIGRVRDKIYRYSYGDKETFWLGFETALEEYAFNPSYPGAIGVSNPVKNKNEICSKQLLHAVDNEPFWFNSGLAINKYGSNSPPATFKDWSIEPGNWQMSYWNRNMACLTTESKHTVSKSLQDSLDQISIIFKSEQIQKEIPNIPKNIILQNINMENYNYESNGNIDFRKLGSAIRLVKKEYNNLFAVSYTHLTLPTIYSV